MHLVKAQTAANSLTEQRLVKPTRAEKTGNAPCYMEDSSVEEQGQILGVGSNPIALHTWHMSRPVSANVL